MAALKNYYKCNDLRQHKQIILQSCTCWASSTGFVLLGCKAQTAREDPDPCWLSVSAGLQHPYSKPVLPHLVVLSHSLLPPPCIGKAPLWLQIHSTCRIQVNVHYFTVPSARPPFLYEMCVLKSGGESVNTSYPTTIYRLCGFLEISL